MSDVKPSGPLWAYTFNDGELSPLWADYDGPADEDDHPCRLIPGHGRVVPLELVKAIRDAYETLLLHYGDQWLDIEKVADVSDALDSAIKGAL